MICLLRNPLLFLSNEPRICRTHWWASSRGPTCCSCVRAPLGESLSPLPLSPQLPFPKEKKRRTRSGEDGRRHYRKAGRNTTFTHAICWWIGRHMNSRCCSKRRFETKRNGDCYELCVVSRACATGPALCGHNNGQNNYWKSNVVNRGEDG